MTAARFGRRRALVGLIWAASLGLLVGLMAGEPQRLSVDLWLVAVATWLAWILLTEMTAIAPVRPDRLRGVWSFARSAPQPDTRPRSLVVLEGLLINARSSERAMSLRLQPRLIDTTDHLLRSRHGIDAATSPGKAAALFGDLAWVVDADVTPDRSPSLEEIEQLLDIATGEAAGD